VRILALGDSFTFGPGNTANHVWTAVMERSLRARGVDATVINAGVEGYDTRSEFLLLQQLAPSLHPNVVVLGFLANDVYTNLPLDAPPPVSSRTHQGARKQLHTLVLTQRLLSQWDHLYARLFLLTQRSTYYAAKPSPMVERQLDITASLLTRMNAYCREHGIELVVVSIPQQFAVLALAHDYHFDGIDPTVIDRRLEPTAREQGFAWIDLLPALSADYRAAGVDLYFRVDGHLTERGGRVAGETTADAIAAGLASSSAR
jgi:hypothetical protein